MTTELSNADIALFSLYRLGGAEHSVHTEDIALECFKLAPTRFSWKKYPQYPESEPAREALFDARRERGGKLVRRIDRDVRDPTRRLGSRMEWMLTPAGVDYIKARLPRFEQLVKKPERQAGRQETQKLLNELERHSAFRKFASTGGCETVEAYEFTDFLRCTLDSTPAKIREKLETLKTRAHDAQRAEILAFLDRCEQRFAELLRGKEPG
jgi:hypothetical protein